MKIKNKIILLLIFLAISIILILIYFLIGHFISLEINEILHIGIIILIIIGISFSLMIVFGFMDYEHIFFFTSKRIFEKNSKKTKEIFIENISNIALMERGIRIILFEDNGDPYINSDTIFTDDEVEICNTLFFRSESILILCNNRIISMKILDFLKDRLELIKYDKIQQSKELNLKICENRNELNETF